MDAPGSGTVHVEHRGSAPVIWIDNPTRRNALTRPMILDLLALLTELDADPEVNCIVVRGAHGTFCSGLDLTSLGGGPASGGDDDHTMVDLAEQLERRIATLRTLTVAVVEGYAVGAGCQIALCCDVRLVAPEASFAIPVARLGLVYPPTSVERLVHLVGSSRATLMLATGRRIDAATAHLWGLATDLASTSDGGSSVDADLDALLADIAAGSRLSLAGSLEMVRAISGQNDTAPGTTRHDSPAAIYRRWSELTRVSGEHAEALAARAERRPPVFRWRPDR